LPLIAHASGIPLSDADATAENLMIHLGPGFLSHVHDLTIPYALLQSPPVEGVELTTTQAMLHRHIVKLTQDQLVTVNRGGTVTEKPAAPACVTGWPKPPAPKD